MKIALSMLFGLAGYFIWATTFVDSTGALVSALGR
jgi:hypothetical protein